MKIAHNQMRHFNLQELAEAVKNVPDNAKIRGSNDDSFTLYSSEKKKGSETVTSKTGFFANIVKSFQEKAIQKREKKQEIASNILQHVFQNAMNHVGNDPSKTKALEHILNKAPKDLTARHLKSMVSDALDVVEPGRMVKQQLEGLVNRAHELTNMGNTATTGQWTSLVKQLVKLSEHPGMKEVDSKISIPTKNTILLKAFEGLVNTSANEGHQGGGLKPSARKVILQLMERCVTSEVNSSESAGTLFRDNGKLTPALMKYESAFVLKDQTKQSLRQFLGHESLKTEHNLLDQVNKQNAANVLTGHFNTLCDRLGISDDPNVRHTGVQHLPQEICDQMKLIYEKTTLKYNAEEGRKAVGGALLLRLINPSLMSPNTQDEVQPLKLTDVNPNANVQHESNVRSNMTEITTMLQTLANRTTLTKHREVLNAPVQLRWGAWSQFVTDVVARGLPSTGY